jgi:hypothetical protein
LTKKKGKISIHFFYSKFSPFFIFQFLFFIFYLFYLQMSENGWFSGVLDTLPSEKAEGLKRTNSSTQSRPPTLPSTTQNLKISKHSQHSPKNSPKNFTFDQQYDNFLNFGGSSSPKHRPSSGSRPKSPSARPRSPGGSFLTTQTSVLGENFEPKGQKNNPSTSPDNNRLYPTDL